MIETDVLSDAEAGIRLGHHVGKERHCAFMQTVILDRVPKGNPFFECLPHRNA
jgi:hypothetical protein